MRVQIRLVFVCVRMQSYVIYMISTTYSYCAYRFTQQLWHKPAYIVNLRSIISHLDINNGTYYTIWQECKFNEPDWNTNQSLAIQFWGEWFDWEWHAKQWHSNTNPLILWIICLAAFLIQVWWRVQQLIWDLPCLLALDVVLFCCLLLGRKKEKHMEDQAS